MMFTKFGEMNSCKEINELAENLFKEGDIKSLKEMAAEERDPGRYGRHVPARRDSTALRGNGCGTGKD